MRNIEGEYRLSIVDEQHYECLPYSPFLKAPPVILAQQKVWESYGSGDCIALKMEIESEWLGSP